MLINILQNNTVVPEVHEVEYLRIPQYRYLLKDIISICGLLWNQMTMNNLSPQNIHFIKQEIKKYEDILHIHKKDLSDSLKRQMSEREFFVDLLTKFKDVLTDIEVTTIEKDIEKIDSNIEERRKKDEPFISTLENTLLALKSKLFNPDELERVYRLKHMDNLNPFVYSPKNFIQ